LIRRYFGLDSAEIAWYKGIGEEWRAQVQSLKEMAVLKREEGAVLGRYPRGVGAKNDHRRSIHVKILEGGLSCEEN